MKKMVVRLLACSMLCGVSAPLLAYDEPFVNLGQTSFLDGGPPSGPGWYFQDYFQYYTADSLNGNNGQALPLPETGFLYTANIFQLLYMSPQKLFGGPHWAFNVILPWVIHDNISDGLHNHVLTAQN